MVRRFGTHLVESCIPAPGMNIPLAHSSGLTMVPSLLLVASTLCASAIKPAGHIVLRSPMAWGRFMRLIGRMMARGWLLLVLLVNYSSRMYLTGKMVISSKVRPDICRRVESKQVEVTLVSEDIIVARNVTSGTTDKLGNVVQDHTSLTHCRLQGPSCAHEHRL